MFNVRPHQYNQMRNCWTEREIERVRKIEGDKKNNNYCLEHYNAIM